MQALREAVEAQRGLAYEQPWSQPVLRALELKNHKGLNQVAHIASALKLDAKEVEACLAQLRRAKLVRRVAGRWSVPRVLGVDTAADAAGNLSLKRHWAQVAKTRIQSFDGTGASLFSYNLIAVSADDLQRIRQLHATYFEQVRTIVSESVLAERVALLNLQLVALDE